jgi:hypothetical protein
LVTEKPNNKSSNLEQTYLVSEVIMVQAPKMPYSCNILRYSTALAVFKDEFGPNSDERKRFTGQIGQAVIQTTAYITGTV